jgi:hypothetical protein
MGATLAAVGTYFASDASATMAAAAASDIGGGAVAAGAGSASLSAAASMSAYTALGSGTLLAPIAQTALNAGITGGIDAALKPKPPQVPGVTPMPDLNSPEALQARQTSIAEQMARRGRASTILTQPSGGTLGS